MKKVLVFGGAGLVGSRFVELNSDYFEITAPTIEQVDILNLEQLSECVKKVNPETIINLAAFTDVDGAEAQVDDQSGLVYKINVAACEILGKIADEKKIHLIQISTDQVFDGTKVERPYVETDKINPINWYGKTKYLGEQAVVNSGCNYTIVRIEMPYSAKYELKSDFARFFIAQLRAGKPVKAVKDQKVTPVFVDDVSAALRAIIDQPTSGVFHVVGKDYTSPFDFVIILCEEFGFDKSLVAELKFAEYAANKKARRPQFTWLDISKFEEVFGEGIMHTNQENLAKMRTILNQP